MDIIDLMTIEPSKYNLLLLNSNSIVLNIKSDSIE